MPQNILQMCFWKAEVVLQNSPPPSPYHLWGAIPWWCFKKQVTMWKCFTRLQLSVIYLSSSTESIGSTPDVSTTWSWSANRMAFCKHSKPCLVRKSTKASRSSLSTRSAGIWADCRVEKQTCLLKCNFNTVLGKKLLLWDKLFVMECHPYAAIQKPPVNFLKTE